MWRSLRVINLESSGPAALAPRFCLLFQGPIKHFQPTCRHSGKAFHRLALLAGIADRLPPPLMVIGLDVASGSSRA